MQTGILLHFQKVIFLKRGQLPCSLTTTSLIQHEDSMYKPALFSQVVEIASFTEHLLGECESSTKFSQCPRCSEAVATEDLAHHVHGPACNRELATKPHDSWECEIPDNLNCQIKPRTSHHTYWYTVLMLHTSCCCNKLFVATSQYTWYLDLKLNSD